MTKPIIFTFGTLVGEDLDDFGKQYRVLTVTFTGCAHSTDAFHAVVHVLLELGSR
jgi:hypothetical protein